MKKVLLLILIALLSLMACGKKESKVKEKIVVEYWFGLGGNLGKNMQELVNEFNASQSMYEIKAVAQASYDETFQKLQASMAAKKQPALVLLNGQLASTLADKNLTENLNSLVENDKDFNLDDIVGAFREQVTLKGNIYGLPAYGTTQILYYNKEVLKNNGFTEEDLKTWDGLGKVAKAVSKKENGKTLFYGWAPMWGRYNLADAALSNGGQYLSADGTKVAINSDEWVEVWEQFRKWIFDEEIMKINSGGQGWEYWYKTIDDVMQDRALGYTGSAGDQGDLDFNKLAATVQPGWGNNPARPEAGAQVMLIPKGVSKDQQEAAFAFMKFFTSPNVTAKWSINSGYIAVRQSAKETPEYKEFAEKNPQILVPLTQANTGSPSFFDPTNGKILDALRIAADKVQIENIPAKKALDEAAEIAQRALDEVLNK